jgi:DNA-binding transcriptional LysR family regulator
MTSIRQLRYFVEIAECGSFSGAAERLYIAQSALSRQIKELEQQLGTPLFERTARLPRLTLAGQAFLERARRLLADLAQAERVTRDIGQGLQGSLRLNHSSTVPLTGPLLGRLGNYLKDNPGFHWRLHSSRRRHNWKILLPGGWISACCACRCCASMKAWCCMNCSRTLAAGGRRWASLGGYAVRWSNCGRTLHFHPAPGSRRLSYLSASLCMDAGFFPQAAQVLSRKTTQLQLIQAGFGVALLPRACARLRRRRSASWRWRVIARAPWHWPVAAMQMGKRCASSWPHRPLTAGTDNRGRSFMMPAMIKDPFERLGLDREVLTVSQLNGRARVLLEDVFRSVGGRRNLQPRPPGVRPHVLHPQGQRRPGALRAVPAERPRVRQALRDGLAVKVRGKVSLFEAVATTN